VQKTFDTVPETARSRGTAALMVAADRGNPDIARPLKRMGQESKANFNSSSYESLAYSTWGGMCRRLTGPSCIPEKAKNGDENIKAGSGLDFEPSGSNEKRGHQ